MTLNRFTKAGAGPLLTCLLLLGCAGPKAPFAASSAASPAFSAASPEAAPAHATAIEAPPTESSRPEPGTVTASTGCQARIDAEDKAESLRWTPELRAESRSLAQRSFSTGHEAIEAAMAGRHRRPGNAARDKARHPAEAMEFYGFSPMMTVLEFAPAEGWYTEILAAALAKRGKLVVTAADPQGPADPWFRCAGERIRALLRRAPEVYGKVEVLAVDHDATPSLGLDASLDMVLLKLKMRRLVKLGTLGAWLDAFHKALKSGGVLALEEYRTAPGVDAGAATSNGYFAERWVIEQVEAHRFRLVAKSEINANPKDTRDYEPAEHEAHDTRTQRAAYAEFGESDRMTLKFVKVDGAD